MNHALVQTDLSAPTVEQLKRAFTALQTLTEADAIKVAREAYGILLKNLSREEASTLASVLRDQGVVAAAVEMDQLPRLPDAKFVKRLEFQPHALVIYDPLGRPVPIEWPHVTLLAAGVVRHFDVAKTRTEERVTTYSPLRGVHTKTVTDVRHRVEAEGQFLLDIFLAGGTARFQIEAESFLFKYTVDRPELALEQRFSLLVNLLIERAPHTVLNRGAFQIRQGAARVMAYASKAALFEESSWLLWLLAQRKSGPLGP